MIDWLNFLRWLWPMLPALKSGEFSVTRSSDGSRALPSPPRSRRAAAVTRSSDGARDRF